VGILFSTDFDGVGAFIKITFSGQNQNFSAKKFDVKTILILKVLRDFGFGRPMM
jgi:hypothetical protein